MEYLVVIEVSQKQSYIFKTNRLKENVGASIIIRRITEELPKKFTDKAHFVFAGGGKSVYAFESEDRAKTFIAQMSEYVLINEPGVELFMTYYGYDQDNESVIDAIHELYNKLDMKKSMRKSSFQIQGLGITESCFDTQLPAVGKDSKTKRFYSQDVKVKIEEADRYEKEEYEQLIPGQYSDYRFASEFEELGGTKGTKDYIGVVVIDGNKMGVKIKAFRENFIKQHGQKASLNYNQQYKADLKKISKDIDDSFKTSIRNMVGAVIEHLEELKDQGITIKDGALPLRPFIMAGDDICFACDARISLKLAEIALREIEKRDPIEGMKLHGCAGVAMVKSHYPFFRAHELAEALCVEAKSILPTDYKEDESAIDFHIVQGELEDSLSVIRDQKYNHGKLTNKPYFLDGKGRKNSMDTFKERMAIFKDSEIGRGFVKGYRNALREGETRSQEYVNNHNVPKRIKEAINGSYYDGHCIDFDVIEMLDLFKGWED